MQSPPASPPTLPTAAAPPHPAAIPPHAVDDELARWDAVATATAIASGQISAVEVVQAAVDRARRAEPVIGALATATYEQALAEAHHPRGPLGGVPSAVKDLYDVAGVRSTYGSRASGHHVPSRTHPAVAQLLGTGLISIGKSTSSEYGMTPTVEPLGRPPTRNPWDVGHSTGGSSGGAAALVAAGVVPIAHATDGGGSTRIPASCCGLVGLKPTVGRLVDLPGGDRLPVRILASGVVTRTVRDTAAWLALAERQRPSPSLPPIGAVTGPGQRRLRVALVVDSPVAAVDAEVVAATRYAGRVLADLGHDVEEIPNPFGAQMAEDFLRYWGLLAALVGPMGRLDVGRSFDPSRFEPWTKGLAAHARAEARRVPGAIRRLRAFRGAYADLMGRWDLVVNPTVATPPPPLGWLDVSAPFSIHRHKAVAFTPFTPAWNVSGAPAVSLPMARSTGGLPIGVQLGAAHGGERLLLETALAIEEAVPFNRPLSDVGA